MQVIDMRNDKSALEKAAVYGMKRIPTVVIDGKLADRCALGASDIGALESLGVGGPQ